MFGVFVCQVGFFFSFWFWYIFEELVEFFCEVIGSVGWDFVEPAGVFFCEVFGVVAGEEPGLLFPELLFGLDLALGFCDGCFVGEFGGADSVSFIVVFCNLDGIDGGVPEPTGIARIEGEVFVICGEFFYIVEGRLVNAVRTLFAMLVFSFLPSGRSVMKAVFPSSKESRV